ncbi:PTS transporter subunit EIIC [Vallitalea pronyensis]|uniref:PTS transporter subunit EIIC n=1 Tax=Vallitalea pronyensis TaxID=1348613 RepID=A0A8J8MLX7_9FIRM|nr:N-acetylglucosamine-specific PTS transporter subunit IIBC [Vallitalea pronyensis]QUI23941.1 PTS transporter subunit EIIC [Vallitalea pronyensis]
MKNAFGSLQKVGKALMLPVAVMPITALLLRLGVLWKIDIMTQAGDAIFSNLAILFAVGIAFGLAKNNHGAAGLAGLVGYFTITKVTPAASVLFGISEEAYLLNNNILMGILAGIMAGLLYNRFYKTKLPDWLAFFGGKRFVPIVTSIVSIFVGLILGLVWPAFESGFNATGEWIIGAGTIGVFLYGLLNRLLIPLGLHHVVNTFVWFTFGTYNGASGEINRFLAGDPTAGTFLAGFFPIMMFALPAVALAIYTTAKKSNRKVIGGMLLSVAFTSFLTGITEPIEFMFMFLAPVLYIAHAVLTGIALAICELLGCLHGFAFSAGAIDYFLNFNIATKPILLLGVGIIMAVVYYLIFVLLIKKLNLPTPGRTDDESGDESIIKAKGIGEIAKEYIDVLGGRDNIVEVDACITRLRLTLKNNEHVSLEACKALGASGLIKPNNRNIQIIVGTQAEIIAEQIKELL